ncbi:MAG: hypothetical protein M5U31_00365 [Acidimicrobiia bacterium]|nr:hypothetical protein [Acidimicrobiia bacterium]
MRLIFWNMNHGFQSEENRQRAWDWLEETADVALVQEALPPPMLRSVLFRPIYDHRPWGSAVVGLDTDVMDITRAKGRENSRPHDLRRTWPGSVAVGSIEVGGRQITLVSVYGLIDDNYAVTTVNRILTDLVPLFDDSNLGKNVVLGGDLNLTTQWTGSDARYLPWHQATFQRIEAFGLRDCLDEFRADGPLERCGCDDGNACRHIHTHIRGEKDRPWQNDYAFASESLFDENVIAGAQVLDTPELRKLSDHLPLAVAVSRRAKGAVLFTNRKPWTPPLDRSAVSP